MELEEQQARAPSFVGLWDDESGSENPGAYTWRTAGRGSHRGIFREHML